MEANTKIYKAALDKLDDFIQEHAMRQSSVREMVLAQICLLPQPFTADQLAQECLKERISKGTIYNNLELFIEANILHAIERQRGKTATLYELIPGKQTRIQIQCSKCGRVVEIRDKAIDHLIRIRKYSNFELQRYSLFIYGECKHCRKRKQD